MLRVGEMEEERCLRGPLPNQQQAWYTSSDRGVHGYVPDDGGVHA